MRKDETHAKQLVFIISMVELLGGKPQNWKFYQV